MPAAIGSPWPPVNRVVVTPPPPCATFCVPTSATTAFTSGAWASCGGGGGGGGGGVLGGDEHIINLTFKVSESLLGHEAIIRTAYFLNRSLNRVRSFMMSLIVDLEHSNLSASI